jgi:predicted signal transduction protein with EAL and GGDEF domain
MGEINQAILEALPDLNLVVRSDGVIVGNVGGRHLGIADEPDELIGTSLREVWTEDIAGHLNLLVRRTLRTRTPVERRYTYRGRSYEVRVQPQGVDRVLMVLRDASKATSRSAALPMIAEPASTAIESRAAFDKRLLSAVTNCRLRETPLALAAIHLGGLKDARNVLGPATCSRLLNSVLTALQSQAPMPGDAPPRVSQFGRIRSDLLVVLLLGMQDRKDIAAAADRIRRALSEPLVDGDHIAQLRPTIGLAQFPNDGATPQVLLENARAALAAARHSDHDSTVVFCTRTMQIPVADLPDFEQELRWALEHGQLALHYQPILDLKSRETLSFEALIRWQHPVCGEMVPEQFLHVAEHSPLGTEIDEWVLRQACSDLAALSRSAGGMARVAVNLGRRMLEASHLAEKLNAIAAAAGQALERMDVNISERIMSTAGSRLDRLRELRERGVKVFVDGFGTGRIALDRLASLPIDGIGIDRAFIARIEHDAGARAMCQSVVSIARAFGLRSIAVGVEKPAQLDFLSSIGCDAVQGRFLCAPLALQGFDATARTAVLGGRRI